MDFCKKHYTKFKFASAITVTSGVVWIASQVRRTQEILNNTVDTSIIELMEPAMHQEVENKKFVLIDWLKTYKATESSVTKGWNTIKFVFARRLLSLANSENRDMRIRAIKHLGAIKHLDNWQYSILAHMCNARTAVGLARTPGIDNKFFLDPPFKYDLHDHYMFVKLLEEFLTYLNSQSNHRCLAKFINRVFGDDHESTHDASSLQLRQFIETNDIYHVCLESILHHTIFEKYAKDIVSQNGLHLLMEIHNRFKHNRDINVILCRILSNLSVFPELLEEIYRTGWIGVLAEWVKNNDIRLSLPAACALANLDSDDGFNAIYGRELYILHPTERSLVSADADVVFIHGLLGGVFFTWRQRDKNEHTMGFFGKPEKTESITSESRSTRRMLSSSDPITRHYIQNLQDQEKLEWDELGHDYEFVWHDIPISTNPEATGPYSCKGNSHASCLRSSRTQCWPQEWLPQDCQNIRVVGINYDTNLSMWASICPEERMKSNLDERSNEFLLKLQRAGVGSKPIIWITHSMGGLLVKNILHKALQCDNPQMKNMCLNTKAIVFYSTPHTGSRLANFSQATSLVLWPSIEVRELKEDSANLIKLHDNFLNIAKEVPMKVVSFVETKSTQVTAMKFNFQFVEPHSGNPGIGEYYEIPLDHLGICKPANRHSFLYQKIVHIINEVLEETKTK